MRRNKSQEDIAGHGRHKQKGLYVGKNMTCLRSRHSSGIAGAEGAAERGVRKI